MRVTESTVRKITISGAERLDTINVFLEDFKEGQGRVVVECFGDSWAHYWSAMGPHTMTAFFIMCEPDYLARKLSSGISNTVFATDTSVITAHLRKRLIERRRDGDFTKKEARELWDDIDTDVSDDGTVESNEDLYYKVLGDDFYNDLPTEPNPKYEYLIRIIDAVKQGLKQLNPSR